MQDDDGYDDELSSSQVMLQHQAPDTLASLNHSHLQSSCRNTTTVHYKPNSLRLVDSAAAQETSTVALRTILCPLPPLGTVFGRLSLGSDLRRLQVPPNSRALSSNSSVSGPPISEQQDLSAMAKSAKPGFYAVARGHVPGIYSTWYAFHSPHNPLRSERRNSGLSANSK